VNDRARGPGETGAIQRAQLFADVDELKETCQALITAGHVLIETDSVLGEQVESIKVRIDIINKRLRKLENAQ